ncbi:MAG: hypothetical protein ABSC01_10225, partial [Verrucomicrobiota bacterium]
MKNKFTIYDLRFTIWKKSANTAVANRQSPIVNRQSKEGVALIITLILLSVTLIMAVAFLAISRRERNAVTTTTDTASARLAAEAAFANAEAQIVANIFATTNVAAYNFGLLVSTNYINGVGFQTGSANPTNVNYNDPSGNPIAGNNLIQNIANLFYLPRAPVYLSNLVTHAVENRFYLDLNRNGVDDPNGYLPVIANNGDFLHPDGTEDNNPVNVVTNFQVGDPEWIGVLDHPDAPHGPNNLFVARYAFIAVPVGNTLDINAIHNQVFDEGTAPSPGTIITVNPGASIRDRFFRNEGVGSWEINLAAFLADLNTNEWGQIVGSGPGAPVGSDLYYQYNEPFGNANQGLAFDDARALLAYRYANNYNSLASVDSLFGVAGLGHIAFLYDNIDGYSDGILQTGFQLPADNDNPQLPWAGADNTNQFFTAEGLFNTNETEIGATLPGFTDRLLAAGTNTFGGTNNSTYDRYTFYRMLGELGSDSAPESGKINLNYSNAVVQTDLNGIVTNIVIVPGAETNFVPWAATNFFTAAANQMLRLYTTNWFQANPSNYLFAYYGITNNYFYYNGFSNVVNDPTGLGMTNLPFFGMTNQIPAFGITNIPVLINGNFVYSPAVNRLLQLAANIYDSTTNRYYDTLLPPTPLPSVFRPIYNVALVRNFNGALVTNVSICGFSEVISAYEADQPLSVPWNLANPAVFANLGLGIHSGVSAINVFGVPMIIGAKKGFPNFNEFYMESAFRLTRKLQVTRTYTNETINLNPNNFQYYEMFNLSLSNHFGVECWNSYRSNYTRPIDIYVTNFLVMTLTNDENNFSYTTNLIAGTYLWFPNITNAVWPGYTNIYPYCKLAPGSFQIPLQTNFAAAPVSMYRFNGGAPYLTNNLNLPFETSVPVFSGVNTTLPQPHWELIMTNNLQVAMVDHTTGRLIDYVQLSGPNSIRDLTDEILSYDTNGFWDPTLDAKGFPAGVSRQLTDSEQYIPGLWGNPAPGSPAWTQVYDSLNGLVIFLNGPGMMLSPPGYVINPTVMGKALTTNATEVAYEPPALVVQDIDWQVNDPLVHYMAGDLVNPATSTFISSPFTWDNNYTYADNFVTKSGFQWNTLNWPGYLGQLDQRYQPWGGNPSTGVGTNMLAVKDPLVTCSDDWNFPMNKFPTVGWLGRVHRGT